MMLTTHNRLRVNGFVAVATLLLNCKVTIILCQRSQIESENNIRLATPRSNLPDQPAGVVQVFYDGRWGSVCDDNFGQTEADVTCRQLGYNRAITFGNSIGFGFSRIPQHVPIWLDDVDCSLSANSLQECNHNHYGDHNCIHDEDVAVFCTTNPPQAECQTCVSSIRLANDGQIEGHVGVVNAGRVEVFINGRWGTVCDDLFEIVEADVTCRQLGFAVAITFGRANLLGFPSADRSVPIFLDDVNCRITDTALQNCSHQGIEVHNCVHDEDIAVICTSDNNFRAVNEPGHHQHPISEFENTENDRGVATFYVILGTVLGGILLCIILPITIITTCCCIYYLCASRPSTRNLPALRTNRVGTISTTLQDSSRSCLPGTFTTRSYNNNPRNEQENRQHQNMMYITQNVNTYPDGPINVSQLQTIESTHFTSTHTQCMVNNVCSVPQAYQAATFQTPPQYSSV